jgi:hypothetical protein
MTRLPLLLLLSLSSLSLACGDDGGSADGDSGDSGDSSDTGDSGDSGDNGGGGGEACKHLDIVVAVDSSGSMSEEMEAMADEVFGGEDGFARALLDISGGIEDYRVATIDACPNPAVMHTRGAGGECNFASSERWIVGTPDSDAGEVTAEFECVGDIWTGGQMCDDGDADEDEQPALAALRALNPPYIGGENAGFLRNNALLVVIAITDEDEELFGTGDFPTDVEGLYDEYVALKGGVNNMVFLGIGGGPPDGCEPGTYGKALYAEQLHSLTNLFVAENRGVWWDLCDGRLGDGLAAAIEVIEDACDDFNPVD